MIFVAGQSREFPCRGNDSSSGTGRSEFWEFLLFLGFFDYVKSINHVVIGFLDLCRFSQFLKMGFVFLWGPKVQVQEF